MTFARGGFGQEALKCSACCPPAGGHAVQALPDIRHLHDLAIPALIL
jgi:hypothetical protein